MTKPDNKLSEIEKNFDKKVADNSLLSSINLPKYEKKITKVNR